jgi:hypothetical protein
MENEAVLQNSRITTQKVANMLGISFGQVQSIQNNILNACHTATNLHPTC